MAARFTAVGCRNRFVTVDGARTVAAVRSQADLVSNRGGFGWSENIPDRRLRAKQG